MEARQFVCSFKRYDNVGWCKVDSVDLTTKTIGETITFSGSREDKERTTDVQFWNSGRVAHLPLAVLQEFPKLNKLTIDSSEIPIVKGNLLGPQFSQIEELFLSKNKIRMVEEQAFVNLANLLEIRLNDNEIQSLSQKLFESNHKLRHIYLENNQIRMIDPRTFENLNQLVVLDFWENECFNQYVGCRDCDTKINHTVLDHNLQTCYENHKRSSDLLDVGESAIFNF